MREAVIDYVRWAIGHFPYEEPILDTCAGWEPNSCTGVHVLRAT